jgi:biopolymer transport protein ExbD
MRRRRRNSNEGGVMSEINITPFTDVVLVLLIIFMITSPVIISGGMNIKLPKAEASSHTANQKVTVTLDIQKKILLNGQEVNEQQLPAKLSALFSQNTEKQVIVNADYRLTHGWVVHIFDLVKSAGAEKILIGTGSEDNP